jgi:hypothetical protein
MIQEWGTRHPGNFWACGFPPFREEKLERTGHGEHFLKRQQEGVQRRISGFPTKFGLSTGLMHLCSRRLLAILNKSQLAGAVELVAVCNQQWVVLLLESWK